LPTRTPRRFPEWGAWFEDVWRRLQDVRWNKVNPHEMTRRIEAHDEQGLKDSSQNLVVLRSPCCS
jgi:hypothetical protein